MKWPILALLIFLVFLQYQTQQRIDRAGISATAAARQSEVEVSRQLRQIEERLAGIASAEQESTLRLRKKIEALEEKIAALQSASASPNSSPAQPAPQGKK